MFECKLSIMRDINIHSCVDTCIGRVVYNFHPTRTSLSKRLVVHCHLKFVCTLQYCLLRILLFSVLKVFYVGGHVHENLCREDFVGPLIVKFLKRRNCTKVERVVRNKIDIRDIFGKKMEGKKIVPKIQKNPPNA